MVLEEVRANTKRTGHPMDKVVLVNRPARTATRRTSRCPPDQRQGGRPVRRPGPPWSRLARGGILVIDGYGQYHGQRKAVDEHFANDPVPLHRVDDRCHTLVRTA